MMPEANICIPMYPFSPQICILNPNPHLFTVLCHPLMPTFPPPHFSFLFNPLFAWFFPPSPNYTPPGHHPAPSTLHSAVHLKGLCTDLGGCGQRHKHQTSREGCSFRLWTLDKCLFCPMDTNYVLWKYTLSNYHKTLFMLPLHRYKVFFDVCPMHAHNKRVLLQLNN